MNLTFLKASLILLLKGERKGHSRKLIGSQNVSLEDTVVEKAAGWGLMVKCMLIMTKNFKNYIDGF